MVGRKCKADVVLQMAKGVVLELAVVAITEVVAMSHVCGVAKWGPRSWPACGPLLTSHWPTPDPLFGHINGTATIYAGPTLGPCMAHY